MEHGKQVMALTFAIVVMMAFAGFGATIAAEDVGAPAPAPSMMSAGEALCVPALLAFVASLVALLY
ncbi:hypothetical protein LguiB_033969 [Lonicera macranthoides]